MERRGLVVMCVGDESGADRRRQIPSARCRRSRLVSSETTNNAFFCAAVICTNITDPVQLSTDAGRAKLNVLPPCTV